MTTDARRSRRGYRGAAAPWRNGRRGGFKILFPQGSSGSSPEGATERPQPAPVTADQKGTVTDGATHRPPATMLAGTPYRVICRLGAGPTGEVFEVEHVELGKRFALKTLPQSGPRFDRVERLKNEFRALARLAHPNIVAVTDAGTTSRGVPYFVMPRYRGGTLAARLARGPLRLTEALGVAADIASALGAAHGIGVLHRDVRPESILFERAGAKLADFGVAKFLGSSGMTTRHLGMGTPRYMSPEQASGARLDARSDLFSLGLVLYEMIAGAGPDDDAKDEAELLALRTSRPAARLATRVPGLDAEVGALVAKLLALDPVRRALGAATLAAQLRRIAARLAGGVEADTPTREVHYDAVTDPGPAARMVAPASQRDDSVTRPDGIAAGDRTLVDAPSKREQPAKRDEPPTRFDLPRPGAARARTPDAEPTTERIVRGASARPPERAARASRARFFAICAGIGTAFGIIAVVVVACVASIAPQPVASTSAAPAAPVTASAAAPVAASAAAPVAASAAAPVAVAAAVSATSALPARKRPAAKRPAAARRIAPARHRDAPVTGATACAMPAPTTWNVGVLPGSGL